MPVQIVTHYLPYFTERRRGALMAVCGAAVRWEDHSVTPDCQKCQAWINADVKEAEGLVKTWEQDVPR